MQIINKMTWRRDSYVLPLVHSQGHSRCSHARSLAVLLVGLGLFAHVLFQAAVEAAVPAWRALGGHGAYCNDNLEEPFGNENEMLLSFLKSRRKTGNGAHRAVDQQGAASAVGGANSAITQAPTVQVESRNPTDNQDAESSLAPAKFCDGNNSKLGKGLMTFDMSPIVSCPGCRHALCKELRPDCTAKEKPICWAFRDRYREQAKKERLATNLLFSRSDQFVPWANGKIGRRRTVKAVRLPGIGDMYDVDFVRKVRSIIEANPKMLFWCYTRSWAVPEIWKELKTLKAEPNVSLWLSWDRMMAEHHGPPPDADLPWCWLAENDDDLPPEPVAIVWRFNSQSSAHVKLPEKHILGNSLICPHEDGVTKTKCVQCGLCWRGAKFRTAKIGKLLAKYPSEAKR